MSSLAMCMCPTPYPFLWRVFGGPVGVVVREWGKLENFDWSLIMYTFGSTSLLLPSTCIFNVVQGSVWILLSYYEESFKLSIEIVKALILHPGSICSMSLSQFLIDLM